MCVVNCFKYDVHVFVKGLNANSVAYQKLGNYTNPSYTSSTAQGDLSVAIFEVLTERIGSGRKNNKFTIGQMNDLFDELVRIKNSAVDRSIKNVKKTAWVTKLLRLGLSVSVPLLFLLFFSDLYIASSSLSYSKV